MITQNTTIDDGSSDKLELEPTGPISSIISTKISTQSSISATPYTQLKVLMRTTSIGLNNPLRKTLWLGLSLRNNAVNADDFDTQFDNLAVNKLPNFVDPTTTRFYYLNSISRKHVATILWNLSQSYPQMTFAPLLYPLVSLFLHFHTPVDVYRSIVALLMSRESRFIGINRIDRKCDALSLIRLANKFGVAKLSKIGSNGLEKLQDSDAAFADWIQWIFGCLPFHFCVRIVDCYLVEGEKFLYRIAMALARLFEKTQKKPLDIEQMRVFCQDIATIITPTQLIQQAIKITRFSRKDIVKARSKSEKRSETICFPESPLLSRNDVMSQKDVTFGNRIAPRRFKSSILSWNQLDILWEWIPERIYIQEPLIAFCSDENGNSLRTFYSLCGDNEPTIILVKTIKNQIFGAYCSSSWSKRLDSGNRAGQFFGNGETFLFSIHPRIVKYEWVGKFRDVNHLTPSQQLFMSATNDSFSIGGGGGHFGLYIDENLSRGETHRCETFENEPLTNEDPYFDVATIEIIAFC
ncbi:hypothetical protein DERP_011280 [Dermatophagoides pteronyssinus]|uniref:TLDc domain-containing protein n=1 Tax=Dermatophagoides pteronyssinus TaxID=6956 RepID=A0ABQ8J756_DERPT|nr:hypothetical protein DERP_011280 [Dermatophagoides pteronyssinus]